VSATHWTRHFVTGRAAMECWCCDRNALSHNV
jgi:hypothetical protein